MDWLIDWLRDVLGWVLAAIGGWVGYVTVRLHKQSERIAVLEQTVKQQLEELKQVLAEMRKESKDGREKLYGHVDAVRRELKDDINRESDKRQH